MSEHNGTPGSVPADIRRDPPLVMTGDEVVAFLSLPSSQSLERLVRLRRIPVVRGIGKRSCYLRDSIIRALEKFETPIGEGQSGAGEREGPNG